MHLSKPIDQVTLKKTLKQILTSLNKMYQALLFSIKWNNKIRHYKKENIGVVIVKMFLDIPIIFHVKLKLC